MKRNQKRQYVYYKDWNMILFKAYEQDSANKALLNSYYILFFNNKYS